MSAQGRLVSAIVKLEGLVADRDASPAPWETHTAVTWGRAERLAAIHVGGDRDITLIDAGDFATSEGGMERPDAELVVAMRRAVDPVLEWLRGQLDRMRRDTLALTESAHAVHYADALAVADAILGSES